MLLFYNGMYAQDPYRMALTHEDPYVPSWQSFSLPQAYRTMFYTDCQQVHTPISFGSDLVVARAHFPLAQKLSVSTADRSLEAIFNDVLAANPDGLTLAKRALLEHTLAQAVDAQLWLTQIGLPWLAARVAHYLGKYDEATVLVGEPPSQPRNYTPPDVTQIARASILDQHRLLLIEECYAAGSEPVGQVLIRAADHQVASRGSAGYLREVLTGASADPRIAPALLKTRTTCPRFHEALEAGQAQVAYRHVVVDQVGNMQLGWCDLGGTMRLGLHEDKLVVIT